MKLNTKKDTLIIPKRCLGINFLTLLIRLNNKIIFAFFKNAYCAFKEEINSFLL